MTVLRNERNWTGTPAPRHTGHSLRGGLGAQLRRRLLLLLLLLWLPVAALPGVAGAMATIEPAQASLLLAPAAAPPAPNRAWRLVALPLAWMHSELPAGPVEAVWLRIDFDVGAKALDNDAALAIYLPYFAAGGTVWINQSPIASVPHSDAELHARWERPFLFPVATALLHAGTNELLIRTFPQPDSDSIRLARVSIGPQVALLSQYERRLFWVRTMPQITVALCLAVAGFVLFIWWRRRSEVLYGLFGLAVALWGVRTLTFVIELLPTRLWQPWRLVVLSATVGFVIVLAVFTLRLAHIVKPWAEHALFAYWAIGPLWLLLQHASAEPLVNQVWTGGLIPIGVLLFAVAVSSVWRQRTWGSAVLPIALGVALLAGIHDYLVVWQPGLISRFAPDWVGHRLFLLSHAANLLVLTMGGILTARFVQAVGGLEDLNRTLETRVAERECELAANYRDFAELQREQAMAEERQAIMRDLHDGLGSQLFTSLLRVERGELDGAQIAAALRGCIADMRLALDTLSAHDNDLGAALGDFMFRWRAQLAAAGIESDWRVALPQHGAVLAPHAALQVLRIAQEALTNALKHAQATHVSVHLRETGADLQMRIEDDGCGLPACPTGLHGRGMSNMRARVQRLGGTIDWCPAVGGGTRVTLTVPLSQGGMALCPPSAPLPLHPLQSLQPVPVDFSDAVLTHRRPIA
ncbi:MAG: sensor histidine kinase [Burkholderiales bacterium]